MKQDCPMPKNLSAIPAKGQQSYLLLFVSRIYASDLHSTLSRFDSAFLCDQLRVNIYYLKIGLPSRVATSFRESSRRQEYLFGEN